MSKPTMLSHTISSNRSACQDKANTKKRRHVSHTSENIFPTFSSLFLEMIQSAIYHLTGSTVTLQRHVNECQHRRTSSGEPFPLPVRFISRVKVEKRVDRSWRATGEFKTSERVETHRVGHVKVRGDLVSQVTHRCLSGTADGRRRPSPTAGRRSPRRPPTAAATATSTTAGSRTRHYVGGV